MTVRLFLMPLVARRSEHADFLTCPRCATHKSRDYRTDRTPTGASRLRVPKMRVCDERLGIKRDEPPDGWVTEGTRHCRLAHLIFHPRNFHKISALGRAIPASFIVDRDRIAMLFAAAR
jgi:hypothetical protein